MLGDLEKGDVTDTAARASLVKSLAAKTPVWACYPNVLHVALAANELLGSPVEMRHAPIVGGGRRVQTESGLGTIFEPSPEDRAKDRWHQGLFEEAEYELARQWRTTLASNHAAMQGLISGSPTRFTFRDLSAVKMKTDAMIDRGTRLTTLKVALASALPAEYHSHVLQRWKEAGGPPLREFAPYNAHILSVDLFRFLAMGSGLINPQEPSNYVDLAYLYYIPFCQIFISSDRLHRNCIPLFMDKVKQAFVWGHDLRPELAQLVAKYSAHPDIEERGLVGVASDTVFETGTVIGDLLKRFGLDGRDQRDLSPKLSPEAEAKLVEKIKKDMESPSPEAGVDLSQEDSSIGVKRLIAGRRGSFAFMPRKIREYKEPGE